MKRLIIARHGNTFRPNETPTRVGTKTDLPLVEEARARSIGKYLHEENLIPNRVFASPLKRTMQTASLALEELTVPLSIIPAPEFTEIEYGVDENKTEEEVVKRIGQKAIDLWNEKAIVPNGWIVDVDALHLAWKNFANNIETNETVLIVSSNGVMRFAPYILDNYNEFCQTHDIKVPTGGVCIFEFQNQVWVCKEWNIKPFKIYQ